MAYHGFDSCRCETEKFVVSVTLVFIYFLYIGQCFYVMFAPVRPFNGSPFHEHNLVNYKMVQLLTRDLNTFDFMGNI